MAESALTVGNLFVARGGRPVLRDISIDVAPGEITALLGANGAGKSTLVLTMAGILPALRGHTSFVTKKIPVLFFFSGLHSDYHKPSDTWDKINAPSAAQLLDLVGNVTMQLATAPARPTFITVVEDNVTIALLSARLVNGAKGSGRVWTALTFYYPAQTLANADKDDVFREIDPWLLPEGHFQGITGTGPMAAPAAPGPAAGYPAQPAPAAAPPPRPVAAQPPSAPAQLAPGMTREEIVAAIGAPQREMSFEGKSWLTYPDMVVVLEGGKLKSIDPSGQPPAKVAVHSDPAGAEIYLDGQLIGSTPSSVQLPAGSHELSVRLSGYQDWTRSLRVLSGSEINLEAKLEKK